MVGDQRRDLARGDELAHVLGLGLRERAGAPVGLVGRVARRSRAAPEAAVVAVGVDARAGQAERRLQAVAGLVARDQAAVLAPVLVRVREDVDRLVVGGAAAAVAAALQLAGLARGVEAVRVDDRDDDRARGLDQPPGLRVAAAVAEDELVRPLHRVLGRRPLARVVRAHLEEDRLAVARVRVGGDLDALDRAALVRGVVERDRLDEVRVLAGEALHVLAVVVQAPVGGPAAGQLGGDGGRVERGVGAAVPAALRGEVGGLDGPLEAGGAELLRVLGAVQDDLEEARPAVLGDVEAEVRELLGALPGRRGHAHHRGRLGGRRGGQALGVEVERRRPRPAGDPARLDGQRGGAADVADGQLTAAAVGRAGHEPPGQRVEDREVPVARGPRGASRSRCPRRPRRAGAARTRSRRSAASPCSCDRPRVADVTVAAPAVPANNRPPPATPSASVRIPRLSMCPSQERERIRWLPGPTNSDP